MGGKVTTPTPPDYSTQIDFANKTAAEQMQLGRDQLAWAKEQDARNRQTLDRVLGVQLPAMEQQAQQAQETWQRYKDVYQPVENRMVDEAMNYDSPERTQREQGRAMADVTASFEASRRNALERLEGYGVDPSQTRSAALDVGVRTQEAAAKAAAATAATQRIQDTARAMRADVINTGRGMPSQVAANYGGAVSAGQAGIGGANQTTATSAGALTSGLGFTNAALGANNQAANIMNTGFGNQMQAAQFQQSQKDSMMGAITSLAGGAMGAMRIADGGMPMDTRRALPVYSDVPRWKGGGEVTDARPMVAGGAIDSGPSDGSGVDDQVPAYLSVGEYVIPADVVAAKGREFFDKLKDRYHTPAAQQRRAIAA